MKKIALGIIGLLALGLSMQAQTFKPVQKSDAYSVLLDIRDRSKDKAKVEVVLPKSKSDEVVYNLPAMVPGTYKIYNFGQFASEFKAFDVKGAELPVERVDDNTFKISQGKKLYKITYLVDDSFDDKKSDIFAPGGTSIFDKAVLFNAFGFVGYVKGQKDLPFELTVYRPSEFYGTSSLQNISRKDTIDVFAAKDYFQLHDCPILFAKADTASRVVAGAKITIGVFSPDGNLNAKDFMEAVSPVFDAAAAYLGGSLPTDRYTVLVYGIPLQGIMRGVGIGALEHHTSTVVTMPDVNDEIYGMLGQQGDDPKNDMFRHIVAHEFFHIVTPLNIHSVHIADYDFMKPDMSKHLWLYEGITEYNSIIAQSRAGIIDLSETLELFSDKMSNARGYDEGLPMTVASKFALGFAEDQYQNVYEKGALIGLALDLKLRELSGGKTGLTDLLQDLWKTYGEHTYFPEDSLFDIMAKRTDPSLREFFARYVEGAEPLPFEELFGAIGIEYHDEETFYYKAPGQFNYRLSDNEKHFVISQIEEGSGVFADFGLMAGDEIIELDEQKVDARKIADFSDYLNTWMEGKKEGDLVQIEIERKVDGKVKELELYTVVKYLEVTRKDTFKIFEDAPEEELALRKSWINQ